MQKRGFRLSSIHHSSLMPPPLRLAVNTVRISFALRTSASRLFFVLFAGLSLSGYLLGSCVRMASGHPAPHCPVSASSYLATLERFFRERVLPSSFVHCAGCYPASLSYVHSPALNAGFQFVHCAVGEVAFFLLLASIVWDVIGLLRVTG